MDKNIMIIAGEASGDLNAANLIKELRKLKPGLRISGIGGHLMREAGAEIYCDIKDLAVMGLFDVLKKLPRFLSLKNLILNKIKEIKPSCIILVDFSGFNLRLAKAINRSIPTIYYISPQVWASREKRVETIKKYISKMIVIFNFEKEFYQKHGIDAEYVGHPLLDIVKPRFSREEFMKNHGLANNKVTILLMPGSRKTEISFILPVMAKASALLKTRLGQAQFVIAKAKHIENELYDNILKDTGIDFKIIEGQAYDCINTADFCLVASGTATLETAIMNRPFVIIYKMGILNYLLYRPQVKLPFIGMVNIVAKRRIIPEFIQFNAKPELITEHVIETLSNPSRIKQIYEDLSGVKSMLGSPGACKRAAESMIDFIG